MHFGQVAKDNTFAMKSFTVENVAFDNWVEQNLHIAPEFLLPNYF